MTPTLTPTQKHIAHHLRNGKWDDTKIVEENLSRFNERCLVGMIETNEITWDDLRVVGGDVLVARIGESVHGEC